VCGRQDRITPPALSEELAALVPGARLHLVDGSGHMLPAERPDAVAAALRALL
jgi:pimeloyl-ACP methyl ester carboxylesterase